MNNRSTSKRIEELEDAVITARVKVLHVHVPDWLGEGEGTDSYSVISPDALKGQLFTKEQLDSLFPNAVEYEHVIFTKGRDKHEQEQG